MNIIERVYFPNDWWYAHVRGTHLKYELFVGRLTLDEYVHLEAVEGGAVRQDVSRHAVDLLHWQDVRLRDPQQPLYGQVVDGSVT